MYRYSSSCSSSCSSATAKEPSNFCLSLLSLSVALSALLCRTRPLTHRLHTACTAVIPTLQQWKSGVFATIRQAAKEEAAELAELGVAEDEQLEL